MPGILYSLRKKKRRKANLGSVGDGPEEFISTLHAKSSTTLTSWFYLACLDDLWMGLFPYAMCCQFSFFLIASEGEEGTAGRDQTWGHPSDSWAFRFEAVREPGWGRDTTRKCGGGGHRGGIQGFGVGSLPQDRIWGVMGAWEGPVALSSLSGSEKRR
jgi:hypothetical protein